VICRYFAKQIDKLLEYIKDGRAFGELVTYCYVTEFQKRGNPHIHMVIRLKDGPRTPEEYDKYVTARLPPGPPRGDLTTGACLIPKCRCREGVEDPALCGCGAKEDEPCTCDSDQQVAGPVARERRPVPPAAGLRTRPALRRPLASWQP